MCCSTLYFLIGNKGTDTFCCFSGSCNLLCLINVAFFNTHFFLVMLTDLNGEVATSHSFKYEIQINYVDGMSIYSVYCSNSTAACGHMDPHPTVVIATFTRPPVLIGLTSSFKKLNGVEFPH